MGQFDISVSQNIMTSSLSARCQSKSKVKRTFSSKLMYFSYIFWALLMQLKYDGPGRELVQNNDQRNARLVAA
jgi:hypothetical protein